MGNPQVEWLNMKNPLNKFQSNHEYHPSIPVFWKVLTWCLRWSRDLAPFCWGEAFSENDGAVGEAVLHLIKKQRQTCLSSFWFPGRPLCSFFFLDSFSTIFSPKLGISGTCFSFLLLLSFFLLFFWPQLLFPAVSGGFLFCNFFSSGHSSVLCLAQFYSSSSVSVVCCPLHPPLHPPPKKNISV